MQILNEYDLRSCPEAVTGVAKELACVFLLSRDFLYGGKLKI